MGAIGMPGAITALAVLLLHIYRQLKGGYRLTRPGALWRTALMLTFAGIASLIFVLLLIYLGVAD